MGSEGGGVRDVEWGMRIVGSSVRVGVYDWPTS